MSSPELVIETEQQKVVKFRLMWMERAGYSFENAELIAGDMDIDWHFAYDLRMKCQDEPLCMHILYGS